MRAGRGRARGHSRATPPAALPHVPTDRRPPANPPQVELTGPAGAATAVTDRQGYFELALPGASPPAGSLVRVAGGACVDAGTGSPPPVALGALVPAELDGAGWVWGVWGGVGPAGSPG